MKTGQRPPVTERDLWIAVVTLTVAIITTALVIGFAVRIAVWAAGG